MGKSKSTEVNIAASNEGNKDEERGEWASPAEFVLSCLGYAVGLGNVWRFPYICYENGGGAFLIPYFIMLIFVGLPIFFIELSMGQYSGSGPLFIWSVSPLFQGIGVGMLVITCISSIQYNMIITWSLYYMFASFRAPLLWASCGHDYNTEHCYKKEEAEECESANNTWYNMTCYNQTMFEECGCEEYVMNETKKRISASEDFFNRYMLDRSDTMEDSGGLKWDLCLVLLLAWIICWLCVIKGIRSSGKVVYFTVTFPYLILLILLIRGALLEGAIDGIIFYIEPKWDKVLTAKAWMDAAGQIFFSLSVGYGGLMTFASYNKFRNNVYRDTLIVAIGNSATSIFAGFAIFSVLGNMAHELGQKVEDVAKSGSGLAFVAYPEALTRIPPPTLWSILFFFMLLTLGLDSQFAGIENLSSTFSDIFPKTRNKKPLVAALMCCMLYLMGLPMCLRSGIYWTDLMGYFGGGWSLVLVALLEGTVFVFVYNKGMGFVKVKEKIEVMIRPYKLWYHWYFLWIIAVVAVVVILIFNFVEFTPLSYGDYLLPDWAQALGWMMALCSVFMIPIAAIFNIWRSYKEDRETGQSRSFGNHIIKLLQPTDDWERRERQDHMIGLAETHENPVYEIPDDESPERQDPKTQHAQACNNPAYGSPDNIIDGYQQLQPPAYQEIKDDVPVFTTGPDSNTSQAYDNVNVSNSQPKETYIEDNTRL